MNRFCLLLLMLTIFSNLGYSNVSWDSYQFVINDGTALLKKDGEIIFMCDRREVKIVDNHLIVDSYPGKVVDIVIDPEIANAIGREFIRDTDACRGRWVEDGRSRRPSRLHPRPLVPLCPPLPPVPPCPPETATPPPAKTPAAISLPAGRSR